MSFYIEKYQHLGVHFRTVKFANLFKKNLLYHKKEGTINFQKVQKLQ